MRIKATKPCSKIYTIEKVIDDFLHNFNYRQLCFFASDLLDKGFTVEDIHASLRRAMAICRTAKIPLKEHFIPLYSDRDGETIKDCKLSELGFQLLILNANPKNLFAAKFQLRVLKQYSSINKV